MRASPGLTRLGPSHPAVRLCGCAVSTASYSSHESIRTRGLAWFGWPGLVLAGQACPGLTRRFSVVSSGPRRVGHLRGVTHMDRHIQQQTLSSRQTHEHNRLRLTSSCWPHRLVRSFDSPRQAHVHLTGLASPGLLAWPGLTRLVRLACRSTSTLGSTRRRSSRSCGWTWRRSPRRRAPAPPRIAQTAQTTPTNHMAKQLRMDLATLNKEAREVARHPHTHIHTHPSHLSNPPLAHPNPGMTNPPPAEPALLAGGVPAAA